MVAPGWRYVSHRPSKGDVEVVIENVATGGQIQVRALYLVAADGAESAVRRDAGIVRSGNPAFGRVYPCKFRLAEPLSPEERLPARVNSMTCVFAPEAFGLGRTDGVTWRGHIMDFEPDEEVPEATLKQHARAMIGRSVELETVATSFFRLHTRIAENYRKGRVFLVGDAAHVIPPFGGHNGNTGIGDAVDLGWKLAAVLNGWGGESLLDSYSAERKPVAERTGTAALKNARAFREAAAHARHAAAVLDLQISEARHALGAQLHSITYAQWNSNGVVLDQRYDGSPIILSEAGESAAPAWHDTAYVPYARPGHRLPHGFLADGTSLYLRLGPDFTLVDHGGAEDEVRDLLDAARRAGIPLVHLPLADPGLRERHGSNLLLVRPDQHVAWRRLHAPFDAPSVLRRVTGN